MSSVSSSYTARRISNSNSDIEEGVHVMSRSDMAVQDVSDSDSDSDSHRQQQQPHDGDVEGAVLYCKLCLAEWPLTAHYTTTIRACRCTFCTQCMSKYVSICISEGNVLEMTCPDGHCPTNTTSYITDTEVRALVSDDDVYSRYARLKLQQEVDVDPIKRCPLCSILIQRDTGCAQMMCKRCKHVFCWYCLASLDDDFLLRHYDSGPCKNKLGHSRASVIWHRTQVVGIFTGFSVLLLLVSPFLLLAAPCILCCTCTHRKACAAAATATGTANTNSSTDGNTQQRHRERKTRKNKKKLTSSQRAPAAATASSSSVVHELE